MRGIIAANRLRLLSCLASGMLGLVLAWSQLSEAAPVGQPTPQATEITRAVRFMMSSHLSKRPLDDEISRRAMKTFLESFDPRKMYFYQSDIDELMKMRD